MVHVDPRLIPTPQRPAAKQKALKGPGTWGRVSSIMSTLTCAAPDSEHKNRPSFTKLENMSQDGNLHPDPRSQTPARRDQLSAKSRRRLEIWPYLQMAPAHWVVSLSTTRSFRVCPCLESQNETNLLGGPGFPPLLACLQSETHRPAGLFFSNLGARTMKTSNSSGRQDLAPTRQQRGPKPRKKN